MELLFNKDNAADREISELLTYIDADLKFARLLPDVRTATNEMIRLVGKEMYDAIQEHYSTPPEEASPELDALLYAMRYPIAVRAYMLYAPTNDLAHTNGGRKMRKDENQVTPFEWMVEKDNKAQEQRYYRALDDLLAVLEENETWRSSEAYKRVNRLFIRTTDEFDEYFRIESRLVLLKLEPGIRKCEEDEIIPRIGQVRYDALKQALQGTSAISPEDKKLIGFIREASVYYSMAWAMPRLSISIFPEGVLQAYTSDRETIQIKQPGKLSEAQNAQQAFNEDAESILKKIELFMEEPAAPECQDTPLLPEPHVGKNFLSL